MRLYSLIAILLAPAVLAAPNVPKPSGLFSMKVVSVPGKDQAYVYPRGVELNDGTLLLTVSMFTANEVPYFPVFKSTDQGKTWKHFSNITDQVNGWGFTAQPYLYELPEKVGKFPAGTVLASGNSWSVSENGTRIDLYASSDKGRTWKFVSNVARGTAPDTTNGATPIWEPALLYYNKQLVCYYSDQRDPLHGQKLAHQTSSDMKKWGPVVNDVAYKNYTARPGMTVVAQLPTKDWILVYEFPGGKKLVEGKADYPVYYRISKSPLTFQSARDYPIVANNTQPGSSPFVVWTPVGGKHGTIIVSDADNSAVFTNRALGAYNAWEMHATPQDLSYSRYLHIFRNNPNRLLIAGAGNWPGVDPPNVVRNLTVSVVDVKSMLANKSC